MTRYVLYGGKQLGSLAVEAALRESGIAYDHVTVDTKAGEQRSDWFTALNPRQQLPALRLPTGEILAEGPAILTFIADSNPSANLIPIPGTPDRGRHDRWLAFLQANVYEGELRKLFPDRYCDDAGAVESVKRSANAYVERQYRIFEAQLGEGPFFLGDHFTVLDIYVWMLAQWMPRGWLEAYCPRTLRLADQVAARPRIAPVHAYHFEDGPPIWPLSSDRR